MTDTTTTLTYAETVTLTVQPDMAWVLTILLTIGIVSVIHVLLEWKDEIVQTVKGWMRRG